MEAFLLLGGIGPKPGGAVVVVDVEAAVNTNGLSFEMLFDCGAAAHPGFGAVLFQPVEESGDAHDWRGQVLSAGLRTKQFIQQTLLC